MDAAPVLLLWPALTRDRSTLVATPAVPGLFGRAEVNLPQYQTACVEPIAFTPDASAVRLIVLARSRPPMPLEVTTVAPGYRKKALVEDYEVGRDSVVIVPLGAPPRETVGKLCIRNAGRRVATLIGTDESRAQGPAKTTVFGNPVSSIAVALVDPEPSSTLDRIDDAVQRASDLTGGLAPVWLLWPLLVLVVLGIPAATLAALVLAVRAAPALR